MVHHSVGFAVYLRDKLQKTVDSADLAKRVDRLHYNETHNASECVYVGVCSEALLLINKEFQCVYECCTKATIIYAVLNLWNGDIVTCGQGNITVRVLHILYLYQAILALYLCRLICSNMKVKCSSLPMSFQ